MAQSNKNRRASQVESEVNALQRKNGLPFRELLSEESIGAALLSAGIEFRERIYTPFVTLWAFLSQVMGSTRGTCEDAVARVAADRAARGKSKCSSDTNSYCKARHKLPEQLLRQLTLNTGDELHRGADPDWLWKGRSVKLVDGTTALLADTPKNQAEYPQSSGQKPGLGFPIMRLVMIFSLAVGTVLECAVSACCGKGTGELTLFRQLWNALNSRDILLGDRLYDSYRDIAMLMARGVDCMFGKKQSRHVDFRKGRRLGPDDHVVVWPKPKYNASRYASREEWEALPDQIEMRETRRIFQRNGFRTRVVCVVSTLIDAEMYPADELTGLFAERWHCELDMRAIKRTLGMHHLKCHTPEMARKEVWVHLLGYNLIRTRMAQAAAEHNRKPRELSFTATQTYLQQFHWLLDFLVDPAQRELVERVMLASIAGCRVGDRKGRHEPRAIKRRKQKYSFLTKPRNQSRQRLAA
jgi:hypothetical protein